MGCCMARMYPALFDRDVKSSAERRLFEAFARELDDEWVVLHHVKWIGNDEFGRPHDGEADFVVAHPYLGVLVLEVKGGRIRFDETTGHFISKDRDGIEYDIGDPFEQAMKSEKTLLQKMRGVSGWPGRRVNFGHAVALPDIIVQAGWLRPNAPREIVIDALDLASLDRQLSAALTFWSGQVTPTVPHYVPPGRAGIDALVRTLAQSETIRNPLLAEISHDDEQHIIRLTQGQFHFLRFLRGQRRAAIAGCAGSGKTLLAIEKARQLAEEGLEKILFTCYNHALAQYLGEVLGYQKQFDVFSFHQLCVYWANQAGQAMTYREEAPPDYFNETLPNVLMEAIDTLGSQYDALIVDEGQDFRQEWWEVLPWMLHDPADGIFYVFFDDNQRVYRERSPIPVAGEPYLLDENCRNTQLQAEDQVEARNLIDDLLQRGILTDVQKSPVEQYLSYTFTGESRLAECSVSLLGTGPIGVRIAHSLLQHGISRITLLDDRRADGLWYTFLSLGPDPGRQDGSLTHVVLRNRLLAAGYTGIEALDAQFDTAGVGMAVARSDFIVLALEQPDLRLAHLVNRFCIRERKPWLLATIDGNFGLVGPLFLPVYTACYNDYRTLTDAATPSPEMARRYHQHILQRGASSFFPGLPAYAEIVAGYASLAIVHFLVRESSFALGRVLTIDFDRMLIDVEDVLKLPRCPVCGGEKSAYQPPFSAEVVTRSSTMSTHT
jgi:bacteriocin biosynthesis cyclodehydratase domain-containing protein